MNFDETVVDRIKRLEREVERLRVKESPGLWRNYTPTLSVSGGTAPTYTGLFVTRYCRVGKLVTVYGNWYNASGGIAGAGGNPLLTSLPIAAATNALDVQIGTGAASLGAAYSVIGVYLWDSTHFSFTTLDWGNVTGSDQNAIDRLLNFTMMYEAA